MVWRPIVPPTAIGEKARQVRELAKERQKQNASPTSDSDVENQAPSNNKHRSGQENSSAGNRKRSRSTERSRSTDESLRKISESSHKKLKSGRPSSNPDEPPRAGSTPNPTLPDIAVTFPMQGPPSTEAPSSSLSETNLVPESENSAVPTTPLTSAEDVDVNINSQSQDVELTSPIPSAARKKRKEWRRDEDEKLCDHVGIHGPKKWHLVAALLPGRSGNDCSKRWRLVLDPRIKTGKFTEEEDALLLELHISLGNNWVAIAAKMPGRTCMSVLNRWSTLQKQLAKKKDGLSATLPCSAEDVDVNINSQSQDVELTSPIPSAAKKMRTEWRRDEDEKLCDHVGIHGPKKWHLVAALLPGRSGNDCSKRWRLVLDPRIKTGKFTEEEDALLLELHISLGNNWVAIAAKMPGRTCMSVLNRWSTLQKQLAKKKDGLSATLPCSAEDVDVNINSQSQDVELTSPIPSAAKKMRTEWRRDEDKKLRDHVGIHGPKKWHLVAALLPGRSGKDCNQRWTLVLDPRIKTGKFTEEEDALLLELHISLGNNWVAIAAELPGRTRRSVRVRWLSLQKQLAKKDGTDEKAACPSV